MIVENTTRWNTQDLKTIVDTVKKHYTRVKTPEDRLIIFKTLRADSWESTRRVFAHYEFERGECGESLSTVVISIKVPNETASYANPVLDSLAMAASDCNRAINDEALAELISVIKRSLKKSYNFRDRWSNEISISLPKWARDLNLRYGRRSDTNTPEYSRREIDELQDRLQGLTMREDCLREEFEQEVSWINEERKDIDEKIKRAEKALQIS